MQNESETPFQNIELKASEKFEMRHKINDNTWLIKPTGPDKPYKCHVNPKFFLLRSMFQF
jgi:hypothetical protein